ncbi:hypothetical protein AB0D71_35000 [Streptomyces avermitilis]|uniref:hypothetical protein n=1 Tax=Streptomyces avermitilis TaxID=33903 RepID=UPI0033FBC5A2
MAKVTEEAKGSFEAGAKADTKAGAEVANTKAGAEAADTKAGAEVAEKAEVVAESEVEGKATKAGPEPEASTEDTAQAVGESVEIPKQQSAEEAADSDAGEDART